jgi:hypothetical protein
MQTSIKELFAVFAFPSTDSAELGTKRTLGLDPASEEAPPVSA